MPLPPKDDPDYPLFAAARSMTLLGVVQLLLAFCVGAGALMAMGGQQGQGQGVSVADVILLGVVAAIIFVPAVLLLVASSGLKSYKAWAATLGIVLVSLGLCWSVLATVGGLLRLAAGQFGSAAEAFGGLAVPLLFALAYLQLILLLSRSYAAIRLHNQQYGHGFEPQMRG